MIVKYPLSKSWANGSGYLGVELKNFGKVFIIYSIFAEGFLTGKNELIMSLRTLSFDELFSVYDTCLLVLFCVLLSRYLKFYRD